MDPQGLQMNQSLTWCRNGFVDRGSVGGNLKGYETISLNVGGRGIGLRKIDLWNKFYHGNSLSKWR